MPDRTACKFCARIGFVRRERVIKAGQAIDAFYCGSCNRSWEESEESSMRDATDRPRERNERKSERS